MAHAFSRQTVRKGGKISQKGIHLLLPEVFRAGRVKIQQQKHLHALGKENSFTIQCFVRALSFQWIAFMESPGRYSRIA